MMLTNVAATDISLKLYLLLSPPKNTTRELDATIIMINVVAIQNGPYKSGLSFITYRNTGFKKIADLTLSTICYY
jgi:hypothetical protein